jgi:hypothetical protein
MFSGESSRFRVVSVPRGVQFLGGLTGAERDYIVLPCAVVVVVVVVVAVMDQGERVHHGCANNEASHESFEPAFEEQADDVPKFG